MSEYGRTKLTLFLILILASAIIGTAGAALTVTVTSSPGTLVANGLDNATIRVLVMDGSTPVPNQPVDISVHNPLLGTLTPTSITTGPLGYAESQFSVATTSGTAIITAIVPNATPSAIAIPLTTPVADTIVLSTDKTWVVANGQDQATVTATLTNTSYGMVIPVVNQNVVFTLAEGAVMGNCTPSSLITNSSGVVVTRYNVGVKSGNATITATAGPSSKTLQVKVDHDEPYRMTTQHDPEVTVGNLTEISVHLEDRWGNPIDNRRSSETTGFYVASPDSTARFSDGYGSLSDHVNLSVNDQGDISASLQVSATPGWNNIEITPPAPVASKQLSILALSNGIPTSLLTVIDPATEWQYADGVSKFSISYNLYDRFGNNIANSGLRIVSSEGDDLTGYTDSLGMLTIEISPQNDAKNITITTTALSNTSLVSTKTVQYIQNEPVNMIFTASPMILPSGEVPLQNGETSYSEMRAKVINSKGNGVSGQTVTFSISNIQAIGASVNPPYLESDTVTTDANGYAIIRFRPGTFKLSGETGYVKNASASCSVNAQWASVPRALTLTWKNYPILYLEGSSSPPQVNVGNYTYVTLKLKGDGFAIVPNPIDVILCTDRSGSMLYDDPDRMHSVREAGKGFVNNLSSTRDQAGLVTFGRKGSISRPGYNSGISTSEIDNVYIYPRSYADYATIDIPLTSTFPTITTELDKIVPDHGTPMRYAIYRSIKDIKANARSNSVRAIILLSDGDYNWYGDPLARGSSHTTWGATEYDNLDSDYHKFGDITNLEQNLTKFALNNNIKIFSIGYSSSISQGGKTTLRVLAEGSGGKYYDGDAANINDIYTDIAGQLQTEAGSAINIAMDFGTVTVDDVVRDNNGDAILKYAYAAGPTDASTKTVRYVSANSTLLASPITDDSANWNTQHRLSFNVGKINLGDYWQTQFRLIVNANGLIDIFGPGSGVDFTLNGVVQPRLELPKVTIYGSPNLTSGAITCAVQTTVTGYSPQSGEKGMNAAAYHLTNRSEQITASWTVTSNCTATEMNETLEYFVVGTSSNWAPVFPTRTIDTTGLRSWTFSLADISPPVGTDQKVLFRVKIGAPAGVSLSGFNPDNEIRAFDLCSIEASNPVYFPESGSKGINSVPYFISRRNDPIGVTWNVGTSCSGTLTEILEYKVEGQGVNWTQMYIRVANGGGSHGWTFNLANITAPEVQPGQKVLFRVRVDPPPDTHFSGFDPDSEIRSYVLCNTVVTPPVYSPEGGKGITSAPVHINSRSDPITVSWDVGSNCTGQLTETFEYKVGIQSSDWVAFNTRQEIFPGHREWTFHLGDISPEVPVNTTIAIRLKIDAPSGISLTGYDPDSEIRTYLLEPPIPTPTPTPTDTPTPTETPTPTPTPTSGGQTPTPTVTQTVTPTPPGGAPCSVTVNSVEFIPGNPNATESEPFEPPRGTQSLQVSVKVTSDCSDVTETVQYRRPDYSPQWQTFKTLHGSGIQTATLDISNFRPGQKVDFQVVISPDDPNYQAIPYHYRIIPLEPKILLE